MLLPFLAVTNVVLAYDIRHDSDSELTGREPSSESEVCMDLIGWAAETLSFIFELFGIELMEKGVILL